MFAEATDWLLRRAVKMIIKGHLARYLATELDVTQLSLQLSNGGTLELRDCLLDPLSLNEHLASLRRPCIGLLPGLALSARSWMSPRAGEFAS